MDAQLLLRHVLRVDAAYVATHPERALTAEQAQQFDALVLRRQAGEPVAYLVGEREFYGRYFQVTPAVLVPRPETELLVDFALAHLPRQRPARVLDLGCGSGCVAISIAAAAPQAEVVGVEVSPAALQVAAANVARHGCPVRLLLGHWFEPLDAERFDLIVANPPYVAEGDRHLEDLRFEPAGALVAGSDGLVDLRLIAAGAPDHLLPGGWLACEHGYDQAEAVQELFAQAGFAAIQTVDDLAGLPRMTCGRRP